MLKRRVVVTGIGIISPLGLGQKIIGKDLFQEKVELIK